MDIFLSLQWAMDGVIHPDILYINLCCVLCILYTLSFSVAPYVYSILNIIHHMLKGYHPISVCVVYPFVRSFKYIHMYVFQGVITCNDVFNSVERIRVFYKLHYVTNPDRHSFLSRTIEAIF